MNFKQKIEFWKENANQELVDQINSMSKKELEESFTHQMKFGTAGIRGKIGPGTNRMNIYNVIKPTYGYAKFLKEKYDRDILVVIGTDNRHKKEEFSQVASMVLSSFGIKVAKALIIPTPFVSFAIRELKAQGGIIITASHNPADNNGYKVYDETGSQLLPNDAEKVSAYSEEKDEFLTYKYSGNKSLIKEIPQSVFEKYQKQTREVGYMQDAEKKIKIVFSPQHGTSAKFIPKYLRDLNYEVIEVKEQMSHDPDFSNTPSPNPELPEAYELGIKYAKKNDADIFITTDPDADRIGVAAIRDGKFEIINGNQMAPILFDHIIKYGDIKNSYIVYSYVSTHLCEMMAKKNGIDSYKVATGFKWIGSMIEKKKDKKFIFGFEESYGSLINSDIARDKDSIQAAILVSEIANLAKKNGLSLWDLLDNIYKEYEFFNEETKTKAFDGLNAIKDRVEFMEHLRKKASKMFKDKYQVIDLSNGLGDVAPMNLVRFSFDSGSWIAARPSGTEPKIKFYKVAVAPTKQELKIENKKLTNYIKEIMEEK